MTPAPAPRAVCKVGGSLLDLGLGAALLEALRGDPGEGRFVVLAGGGRQADRFRARHDRGEMGETAAHWEAVGALDAMARVMARRVSPPLPLATSPGEAAGALADHRLVALVPGPALRREDPFPHSWDVTSDSIAAWAAGRLAAGSLLLLKARDMPADASLEVLARRGVVDRHLPEALRDAPFPAWALNGREPRRLRRLLEGDPSGATRLA